MRILSKMTPKIQVAISIYIPEPVINMDEVGEAEGQAVFGTA